MSFYSVTGTDARNAAETAQAAAESAKAAAESAKAAAEAALDYVDDRNLGAKASDPSVDNDGNALLTGSQYFNTSDNTMRVYNGTAWQLTAPVGALINTNNLSDVANTATAKANLSLDQVDNTSDLSKPISTATQTALSSKVPVADVIDDLVSTDTAKPLSAAQGKILQDGKVDKVAGKGLSTNDYTTSEKTKLTGIETSADVTDTTNVVAALTAGSNIAISADGIISATNTTYTVGDGGLTQNNFTNALLSKLNGIETSADVTDTANVVGALTAGTDITIAADGTISSTATASSNTTYGISWVDSNNDAILRLTPSTGSNDDLTFIAGTNITLTPSGDNLTLATTATVNDTDANLKARANHTGTQAISTITGLQSALDAKVVTSDIINNLSSTDTAKPLSAAQGKALADSKVATSDIINGLTSTDTAKPLSAAQGKILEEGKVDKVSGKGLSTHDFTTALKTALESMEANATADQTDAEIRALVDSATDSNVFTDADHTKLNAIEAGATADQTDAEIRAAVEAASDSNVFTDADHSKLNAIEAGATADQTGAEIKSAYEAESDTNAFTDAEKTKLAGIETSATADQTDAEIETAYNNQVAQVSSSERTAGTETGIRRYSPADVKSIVDQHAGSVSVTSSAVDSAGAVMNTDTTTASMGFVIDEDDFSSDSATKVPTQQSVKAYIASYLDRVGTYVWADTQPSGTLPCNGSAYSRSDYAALYAKNGPSGSNSLGPGNGSTTFNTLDPRGLALRVTDDGKGVDPDASSRSAMFTGTASGDAPGSIQGDRNASHHHFAFHDSAATSSSTVLSATKTAHESHSLIYANGVYRYEILGTTSAADVGKTSTQGGTDARMKNFGTRIWVYYE